MTTSQNGWTASSDKAAIGIKSPKLPGTNIDFPQGIREGDVTVVLLYVADRFNKSVEPLRDGSCWGYDYKNVEGASDLSNHASGTAIDLNANRHPMGNSGTFSSGQVAKIRQILAFCEGVVRWGGDYSGRKDEMHFEINAKMVEVARIAKKISGSSTSTPTTPSSPSTHPAPGPAVAFPLPEGYFFGPKSAKDDSVSGYYNRSFKGHLDKYWLEQWATQVSRRGWSVGTTKTYLHVSGNDGLYGPEYETLIKAFQKDQHLTQDGLLGVATWNAAYHNPVS